VLTFEIKRSEPKLYLIAAVKKAKPIPLQAWTGLEGSRRLRFPDF
jgi:hypothetical protein